VVRLADRLSAARRRRFIGRAAERALFQSALLAPEWPFQVLHVFGPGGVGKTSLLREFAALCDEHGVAAYYLDARHMEPAPEAFGHELRLAMGVSADQPPLAALAPWPGRHVILVDTYETIAPLDAWLREVFLPELPAHTLVVFAGRPPPSPSWRTDLGWQALVRLLPLRNLSRDESVALLTDRGVPPDQQESVVGFTHGHPLALSLVADLFAQRPGIRFQPQMAPDVVKTLLEQFVQQVPGPAHRAALEACALVRAVTEPLLAELLAMPDAHDLFEWLRGLSFVESGPPGLFPHDLAREALAADVRWRNPDWYAELHRRARTYYTTHLAQVDVQQQQRLLFDLIYLHRDNAVMRPFFEWQESGAILVDAPRPVDWPHLVAMVERHEGPDSAAVAARWFARQPEGVLVFRDAGDQQAGFLCMVALHRATPDDLEADPAAAGAWRYLQAHAPLRPGERATLFRFWMARETYQAVSAIQSLAFVNAVRHYLTTPALAFTFFPCADPEFWAPLFAYGELPRLPAADFVVGRRQYGVYGHDWRTQPPPDWLALLAQREIADGPQPAPPAPAAEPLLVLSEPDFAAAVHQALRDLARPEALQRNPLSRSRLVVECAGPGADPVARAAALRELIIEAAEALRATPRRAKWYRAVYHTYVQPAPTQEAASELLDLPFSTYRRHVAAGVAHVTAQLWQQEIGGAPASANAPRRR
jgi:hypothetical protein